MTAMNNKQALLEGAVKCLLRLGYARTTARDVAAEANVSLAAIGYHYGTIQALLNHALIYATDLFSEALNQEVTTIPESAGFDQRFKLIWDNMYRQFDQNRQLWNVNIEVAAQAERVQSIKETLVKAQPDARQGLAVLFHGRAILEQPQRAETVGAMYQAMLFGLLSQRLISPASSPSPEALLEGFQYIARALEA